MGATARLTGLALVSVMLAGCSETNFQDWFGAGKYIPDESLVHQGQVLAAPPDLQLRPPGDGQKPDQRVAQAPQPVDTAPPPPYQQSAQSNAPLYEPQKAYQPAPQQQPVYQQQQAYQPPQPQQVPQAQQPQQPQQLQPQAANDPYAKWGVSRYKADGTKKTRTELDEEMRQKRLEYERQKNPNYGTIFNLGSVWTDG